MTDICPCCPFIAARNAEGAVRSDVLRRHVFRVHKKPELTYVDTFGYVMEAITDMLVIKKNKAGKYVAGFCFECGTLVPVVSGNSASQRAHVEAHVCKETKKRAAKTPRDPKAAAATEAKRDAVEKAIVRAGLSEYIVHTDDINLDINATLKTLCKEVKKPAAPISVIDQLKKEKGLAALKLDELVAARLAFIQEAEQNQDSEDEDYEPEVYNEVDDILVPILIQYVKAGPIREKQSETINALKHENYLLQDQIEQMKSSSGGAEEDLNERIMELSRQLSEETQRRHAAEARLKAATVEAPAAVPDKIELVAENNFALWSLPYQG